MSKKDGKSKKKFFWQKLFNNNHFVLIFSLVASCVIWLLMMNGNTDETQSWKIDNVPITVEYTTGAVESGYKVYDTDRASVTVLISGNSLSVRQVQASDVEVVATITDSVKPGSNTISLTARKKSDSLNSFVIESVEPGTLTAEIDVAKEAAFPIGNGGIQATAKEHYYMGTPQLSAETISISGPETVVSQISSVQAEYVLADPISETKSFSAPIVLYNESGEVIKNEFLNLSLSEVDVKIPVYWQDSIELEATFTNKPTSFPSRLITVSPEEVVFAGAKESFDSIQKITLNPIDFSKVHLSTTKFSVDIVMPDGFINTGNTQTATIGFDLSGYVERWINIEEITIANAPPNVTVEIPDQNMNVLVLGPNPDIGQLTDQNIYARVNLSGHQFTESGETQLPVTVSVQDNTTCWVYGTYTVMANVTVDS